MLPQRPKRQKQVDFDVLLFCFSTSPAHKYYLAVDPVSESLYLSDTNTRKVYKAKSLTETKDLAKNADVVAGTGDQCLPFDQSHCGDGGKASEASLNSPRGKKRPYLGYLVLITCICFRYLGAQMQPDEQKYVCGNDLINY